MAEKISSVNNELVKAAAKLQQRKYRDAEGKFLLEGGKCVEEALNAGIEIETIFRAKECGDAVMKKISTTDTPPEVVAVAKQKIWDKSVLASAQKVVLLENIKDVGNLGTILRTCTAFGVDAVVLYGDCADIYNPKCVRASAGNLWKTPVVCIKNLEELSTINYQPSTRIATLPRAKTGLKNFIAKQPWLLMFGSEADGLSEELTNFATLEVKIEMTENVESLNLSASCAVILYELTHHG